jgi:hypothetical protein
MNRLLSTWPRAIHAVLVLAALLYSGWYCSHDYTELISWWMRLENRFYGSATWTAEVCTPAVYAAGRIWCIVAVASTLLTWATYEWGRRYFPVFAAPRRTAKHFGPFLMILLLGSILWWLGARSCPHATDEVFSAVHFARLPAFQTIAHYALPNNHLFFNLLNGCFDIQPDTVTPGRVLSGLCYVGTLWMVYGFTSQVFHLAALPARSLVFVMAFMAVQFPAWGFGTQARGYSLVLLLGWGSLWAWWQHHAPNRDATHRPPHPIATALLLALSMWTVPTALYWWLGLLLAAAVVQFQERRLDRAWWYAQVLAASCTLLLYLPALTFSGASALAGNKYVAVQSLSMAEFITRFDYLNFWHGIHIEWWALTDETAHFGWALLLLPFVVVPFLRKAPYLRRLTLLYGCILIALVAMVLVQRRWPFYRNLGAQGHLALWLVGLCVVHGWAWLEARLGKYRMLVAGIFLAVGGAVAWVQCRANLKRLPYRLYYYDVPGHHAAHALPTGTIPAGSRLRLDDASYYWWEPLHTQQVQIEFGPLDTLQLPDYQIVAPKDTLRFDSATWRVAHRTTEGILLRRQ